MGSAWRVLGVATFACLVCFAVWLLFAVIGTPIRKEIGLDATEFGLLTATPILSGALLRVPVGAWTDRFGGRRVMQILLITCAVPVWLVSYAQRFWQFLLIGLILGAIGSAFAAVHELLRQRARELGHLDDGADAAATEHAIERTLAEEVTVPEATGEECERWYEANQQRFRSGDLVCVRHVLFQVTPGSPVPAIRAVAEAMLQELKANPELFEARAKEHSNCPSGANGGNLGQLQRGETVPEFEKAIFADTTIGVLPKLVTTRHGFHIIAVDRRIEGKQVPYDLVRDDVAAELRRRSEARALSQYVRVLAGNAEIEGVELDAAASPLVQ